MLTVLIATRNGAATLPRVLDAYCRLHAPDGGWRLLVVDNGSTDASADIVAGYAPRLPLSCIYEARRGKNVALNTALAALLAQPAGETGQLFVFSDDDAAPEPDWLLQLAACAAAHPGHDVFGGAILPDWATAPPEWLARLVPLGLTYGLTAPDLPDGPVFAGLVWGANMALRRGVFEAGQRFHEGVGPNGGAYAMGGETELMRRLAGLGHQCWFCPGARVAHHIRAAQLAPDYIVQRAWRFGRGKFLQDAPGAFAEWRGVPRWMLTRFVLEMKSWLVAALRRDREQLLLRRWELAYLRGYFYQAWLKGGRPQTGKNVLITSYSGELGGMELRMAQEVRFLRAAGYRSALGTRRFPGFDAWAGRLAAERIALSEFDPPLFFEQWEWRRLNRWRARLWGARQLRRFHADLVHVALCWTNYGASALWLAQRCRLPAVLSVHNAFPPAVISDWHRPLLRQAFTAVRGVYAVSESALAHFLAIFASYLPPAARLAVIPNCVDTERFAPSPALRAAARARWSLPRDSLVLGSVARLSEQKQPLATIALFGALRRLFPGLYLVLVGGGPLEGALRAHVEQTGLTPYVIFAGFVESVERVLPAFDLHLLMSRNEGFGIATIEAMACGVPAVATAVPGSIDILRDSAGGMLIPPDDLACAERQVAALLRDPARRAVMGRQARLEAETRYSSPVVGKMVRDFYAGLV